MRYFQNAGKTYGYDETVPSQVPYIDNAIKAGWVEVTGSWLPAPTAAELATQQLASQIQSAYSAGLTVTSTSTPVVNGTYGIRAQDQQTINAVETFVLKNNAFPGSSGTSLAYQDQSGTFHVFPSLTVWSEFANAVANYIADLKMYAAGAPGSSLPSNSVTIA
jgi:hypothetical protein